MNRLPEFNNAYIAMRHGRSVPNEKGLIVSRVENGVLPEYGLVDEGVEQARTSADGSGLGEETIVVTSPFSRAYQTAEVLYRTLNADDFIIDERLRERGFGDMELESADLYHDVWERDAVDATHRYRGVESLCQVAERQLQVISELEKIFARRTIVLVGHADPINVLKAALWGESLRSHRKVHSIKNAEIQSLATMRQS